MKLHELALPGHLESHRQEILADYHEHFSIAEASGKSIDEIISSLGSAKSVAQGYQVTSLAKEVRETSSLWPKVKALGRMILLFIALAPFNFIVFIGPFLILALILMVGWIIPIAMGGTSIAIFGALLVSGVFGIGILKVLSLFFMVLGTLGVSVIFGIVMAVITASFVKTVISFIRWNVQVVSGNSP